MAVGELVSHLRNIYRLIKTELELSQLSVWNVMIRLIAPHPPDYARVARMGGPDCVDN